MSTHINIIMLIESMCRPTNYYVSIYATLSGFACVYSLYKGQLNAVRLYGAMCKCVYLI